jgi:hypothetical protein
LVAHTARAEHVAATLERAARALAVRALEADNRDAEAAAERAALVSAAGRLEKFRAARAADVIKRESVVARREVAVAGREAGVRYAAVEQGILAEREQAVREMEKAVAEVEREARDRAFIRKAALEAREAVAEARERALQAREESVAQREDDYSKNRTIISSTTRENGGDPELQAHQRRMFLVRQQKQTNAVSEEIEALIAEQKRLRSEFEVGAAALYRVLANMEDDVEKLNATVRTPRHGGRGSPPPSPFESPSTSRLRNIYVNASPALLSSAADASSVAHGAAAVANAARSLNKMHLGNSSSICGSQSLPPPPDPPPTR